MKTAAIVAGLLYGDESKGATVEKLCDVYEADLVVRYNGGAQAAHNVVLKDGRHHTFRQFGCGTFQGIPTYLSEFHRVDLLELQIEAQKLQALGVENPWDLMYISKDALLVMPMHYIGDRRWSEKFGIPTCGLGVGEAVWYAENFSLDAIHVYDAHTDFFMYLLQEMQKHYGTDFDLQAMLKDSIETLSKCHVVSNWKELRDSKNCIIFEGAQGVQLDATHGTKPFVTSSNTTYENALELLQGRQGTVEKWGCLRIYSTRHGAGPFPLEIKYDHDAQRAYPEPHNVYNPHQGAFRIGMLNFDVLRSSIEILGKVDYLSVSHLDCTEYPELHLAGISENLGNIGMTGFGPSKEDREMLK